MAWADWSKSVTPISPPSALNPTFRTLIYAGIVTGSWSALLSLIVYGMARGIGVPLAVNFEGIAGVVPWFMVILIPLAAGVLGAAAASLARGLPYAGVLVFWVGTLLAVASCLIPLLQPVEWSTRIWLTVPHVITWFLVVPQIARIVGDTARGRVEEREVLVGTL